MISTVKITSLVDDCVHKMGLLAEHGLSYLVETNEARVLLDTGATDVILRNVAALSVNLSTIDAIVISHGHYDHTGGLLSVLQQTGPLPIHCHPLALKEKLVVLGKKEIQAGPPWKIADIEKFGGCFKCSAESQTVLAGIRSTGQIPRVHPEESVPSAFQRRTDSGLVHDEILDDQCLVVGTSKGLIIVLGCTHSGIINTLDYILSLVDNRPIRAIVGGLHLVGATAERIQWTVEQLRKKEIGFLGLSHCTGLEAYSALTQAFPDRCRYVPIGTALQFD